MTAQVLRAGHTTPMSDFLAPTPSENYNSVFDDALADIEDKEEEERKAKEEKRGVVNSIMHSMLSEVSRRLSGLPQEVVASRPEFLQPAGASSSSQPMMIFGGSSSSSSQPMAFGVNPVQLPTSKLDDATSREYWFGKKLPYIKEQIQLHGITIQGKSGLSKSDWVDLIVETNTNEQKK